MLQAGDELLDVVEAVVEHGHVPLVLLGGRGRDVVSGRLAAGTVSLPRAVAGTLEI